MLWQFSFAEMPGKLVQQYERTLSSSSTGKKTTAWHQSWNPGWFWKTIDPNNSWTSRIIHKKQTYSRPPDPKSIWVLKYPCQKIPSTKQNPPPQFGKLFFLNIYISKQLPPFNGTTHTTERNKTRQLANPSRVVTRFGTCTKIWMPRLIKAESTWCHDRLGHGRRSVVKHDLGRGVEVVPKFEWWQVEGWVIPYTLWQNEHYAGWNIPRFLIGNTSSNQRVHVSASYVRLPECTW